MDIIIGGGISGLSYAYFTRNDFMILEKEPEIGGYCRTINKDGFIWDYSGHFFHFRDESLKKMITNHIDKESLRIVNKHTQIIYNGQYIDFPFQKNIHQLPKNEFIDCLYDLFVASNENVNTFKQMVYANLGKSIADKFLIPYNQKLYACNLDTLDKDAMGRFFPNASKEEIIINFKSPQVDSYNNTFVYPREGAKEYINSISKSLDGDKIFTCEEVLEINIKQKIVKTNKRMLKYDNLINTMPFNKLLSLCSIEYPDDIFSWNKVLVFNLGFDKKGKDTINSWVYVPSENIVFYRVGYYDNIIGGDRMSLYVEIGFNKNVEDIDIDYYLNRTIQDLNKVGIINDEQRLVSYSVVIMDPAYVHINKESESLVREYKQKLAKDNIYSIGRYGSWTYCSIEDNIIEARELAKLL